MFRCVYYAHKLNGEHCGLTCDALMLAWSLFTTIPGIVPAVVKITPAADTNMCALLTRLVLLILLIAILAIGLGGVAAHIIPSTPNTEEFKRTCEQWERESNQ